MKSRGLLLGVAMLAISLMILAAPFLCNGPISGTGLQNGHLAGIFRAADDGRSAIITTVTFSSNDTALAQWGGTIIAGSLALIALIVILLVVAMFRRQSKEGGK